MKKSILQIAEKIVNSERYNDSSKCGCMDFWIKHLEDEMVKVLVNREINNIPKLHGILQSKNHDINNKFGNLSSGDAYFWLSESTIYYENQNYNLSLSVTTGDRYSYYIFSDGKDTIEFELFKNKNTRIHKRANIIKSLDFFFSNLHDALNYEWHEY